MTRYASHVRRTRRFGRGGFTLLEIMISLVLFSVGTLAIMSLMQRAHAGIADGENVLIATHLAQWKLEALRNDAYADIASESKASITTPSGYTRFSQAVTVTTPQTNLKQIVVTVYWDTPGSEADVSLQTHRYND